METIVTIFVNFNGFITHNGMWILFWTKEDQFQGIGKCIISAKKKIKIANRTSFFAHIFYQMVNGHCQPKDGSKPARERVAWNIQSYQSLELIQIRCNWMNLIVFFCHRQRLNYINRHPIHKIWMTCVTIL